MDINLDVKELIEAGLQEEDIEVAEGMPIYDLIVQNGQFIFDRFSRELEDLKQQMSLENPSELDADEVDARLSNFFMERREGQNAFGTIRLLFQQPRELNINEGEVFFGSQGTRFLAASNTSISENEMRAQTQGDFFYHDIEVRSANPGEGNNEEIVLMETEPSGLASIETITEPSGGLGGENNEEFVERAEEQLGLRNLVREQSIRAILGDQFPFISKMEPIGMNEEEMERDLVPWMLEQASPEEFHSGMHTDIYMRGKELKKDEVVIDPFNDERITIRGFEEVDDGDDGPFNDNEKEIPNDSIDYYIYDIDELLNDVPVGLLKVCIITGDDPDQIENAIEEAIIGNCQKEFKVQPDPGSGNSEVQMVMEYDQANLPRKIGKEYSYSSKVNYKLRMTADKKIGNIPNLDLILLAKYLYSPEIKSVQEFIDDMENRVVVADILAKHFAPVFLDISFEYTGSMSEEELENFVSDKVFSDEVEEMSDLIGVVYEQPGIQHIEVPSIEITRMTQSKDGEIISATEDVEGSLYDENIIVNDNYNMTQRIQTLVPRRVNLTQLDQINV